jgi:hypothetical protein
MSRTDRFNSLPLPVDEADLPFYRERTLALLRQYFCMAIETGRVPSLLGREFFRGRVTSCRLRTLEDAVIFVHDMEQCLERLDPVSQKLIANISLQGHTEEEAARRLRWTRRHVVRSYPEAIDHLSAILLRVKLLRPGIDGPVSEQPGPQEKQTVGDVMACALPQHAENRRVQGAPSLSVLTLDGQGGDFAPTSDHRRPTAEGHPKSCQEAKNAKFLVSA